MTVANRAIGAPINIWNDHSDAMSQRDSGWIQLYAETNQHAADLHVQAFRLAEELSTPVMVCMDGFVLTHAFERVDLPTQEQVDRFLPPFTPRQRLDPADPVTIGAMVGPEAFTEVRYLAHGTQLAALGRIPALGVEFESAFGRPGADLVSRYRCEDAETVVVALGSVLGTVKDTVDELREGGAPIGVVGLTTFRPFPAEAIRAALAGVPRVVVLERAFAVGVGGIVSADLAAAMPASGAQRRYTVVAGLGGRPVLRDSIRDVLAAASADGLEPVTFLDLDRDAIAAAERARE
jgi:pyruvate ferredoxin oxidoreductase alpha subunit